MPTIVKETLPKGVIGRETSMTDNPLEVSNPAEFLLNESGAFEVTSPYGQVFRVTCRRGARMHVRQVSEAKNIGNRQQMTWTIRRVNSPAA